MKSLKQHIAEAVEISDYAKSRKSKVSLDKISKEFSKQLKLRKLDVDVEIDLDAKLQQHYASWKSSKDDGLIEDAILTSLDNLGLYDDGTDIVNGNYVVYFK